MFTFKTQAQNIWHVMADGFRLYRASIFKVWYWQIIFVTPAALLAGVDTWLNPSPNLPFSTFYIVFLVGASILVALIGLMGHCFTYSRIHAVGAQGDVSIKASMQLALRKIWPVFVAGVIFIIILLLIVLPVFKLFSLTDSVVVAMIGLSLIYAFVIVALVLVVLYPFFILFENCSVFSALGKSVSHIWGNFWRTLTMLFLLSLLGMAVVFGLLLPLQLLTVFGGSAIVLVFGIIGVFVAYIAIYAFVVPLFNAMLLSLYHDVKIKKANGPIAA